MVDGRLMLNASAAIVAVTGVVGGMLAVAKSDTTNLRGEPNSVWLAGGQFGRVLLGAIGGTRPSYGVPVIGDGNGQQYDVVTAGDHLLVQNRESGQITMFDTRNGQPTGRMSGPAPTDDRSVLVGAGDSAYVVDVTSATAFLVKSDGTATDSVSIDGGFTDWVGSTDGRLWMYDKVEGDTVTFDGDSVNRAGLTDPGADVVLSALGDDPVVLDRTAGKLRWPRRSESIEIADASTAVLQSPGNTADCVTVATGGQLSCIDPRGVLRSIPMVVDNPETAQLFGSSDNLVVAWRDSDKLMTGSWHTNQTSTAVRRDPSGRPMVGHEAIGHLLVDDPGGGFSFSVDHGTITDLEKFSKETIILSPDGGVDGGGVVASDTNASAVADLGLAGAAVPQADTNPRNDPPHAADDVAVTRVGRQIDLNVLANDNDPEGEALTVIDVTKPKPDGSEVAIIGGGSIQFTPGDSPGVFTFDYTIADPEQLLDTGHVTVKVISDDENTDPRAEDDEFETPEGVPIEMPVLLNDVDDEGDVLYFDEGLQQPAHGKVAPLDRNLVYTPAPGFTGADSFAYFVVDGHGGRDQATVRVKVTPSTGKNRPPDAKDDRYSVEAGGNIVRDPLANDTDPDGDALSIQALPEVPGLSLTLLPDKRVAIAVDKGVSAPVQFTYSVVDAAGATDSATITVVVTPKTENHPPIARDDFETSTGQPITIDPATNDFDQDNDPLALIGFTQPKSGGRVTQVGDRQLRFEPEIGLEANATVSFTYTITDPSGAKDHATVHVVINTPSGAPPIAVSESANIFPGETARLAVLANDSSPDGLDVGLDGTPSGPPNAKLDVGPNSVIEFTPLSAEIQSYTFRYCIKDIKGQTACAIDTVNVIAKPIDNTAPVAEDDSDRTDLDQPVLVDVLANDHDNDNDPLRIIGVSNPTPSGSTAIVGRQIRFTPSSGFNGIASFTYTVTDGINPEQTATVLVRVDAPAKVAPITKDDLINLIVGDTKQLNPLANDSDPDGTVLNLDGFGADVGVTITRAGGANMLKITSITPGTYNIPYTVSDADGLTATGTITIVVEPQPNNPPVAKNDNPSSMLPKGSKQIDVLANDFDPDGDPYSIVAVTQPPAGGSVSYTASSVTFTPDSAAPPGDVTFTYTIADSSGAQDTAKVTITVNPCPPPLPAFPDINTTTRYQQKLRVQLFNGAPAPGALAVDAASANGGVVQVADLATARIRYIPPDLFNGPDSYSYTVTDDCERTSTGVVNILVNNAPTASPDSATTKRNQSVDINVLANDQSGDGLADVLTIGPITGASGGTAVDVGGGQIRFTPTPGSIAPGSFTYTIFDEGHLSDTTTVSISVGNDPPIANPDTTFGSVQPGAQQSNDVVSNDTDANNDPLTVVDVPLPTVSPSNAGSVSVNGGSITFTAAQGGPGGPVTITYKVTDGAATDTSTWSLNVNRAPSASNTSNSTNQDNPVQTNVIFGSTSDPDGDALTLITSGADAPSIGSGGSITGTTSGGDIIVTPDPGFVGTLVVTYTITDGFLNASPATLTIDVKAVNHIPTVNSVNLNWVLGVDGPINFSVFTDANANDIDGDALTVSCGSFSGGGSYSENGNGLITVTPEGTALTVSISYMVDDNRGGTANGTLTITVI